MDGNDHGQGRHLAVFFPVGSLDSSLDFMISQRLDESGLARYDHPQFEADKVPGGRNLFTQHDHVTREFIPTLLEKLEDRFGDNNVTISDCIQQALKESQGRWQKFMNNKIESYNIDMDRCKSIKNADIIRKRKQRDWEDAKGKEVKANLDDRLLQADQPDSEQSGDWHKFTPDDGSAHVFFKQFNSDDARSAEIVPCEDWKGRNSVAIQILSEEVTVGVMVLIPDGHEKLSFLALEEEEKLTLAAAEASNKPVRIELVGQGACEGITRSLQVFDDLGDYDVMQVRKTACSEFRLPGKGGQVEILDAATLEVDIVSIDSWAVADHRDLLGSACVDKCLAFAQQATGLGKATKAVTLKDVMDSCELDQPDDGDAQVSCIVLHVTAQSSGCRRMSTDVPDVSPSEAVRRDEAFPEQKAVAQRVLNRVKWVLKQHFDKSFCDFEAVDYLIVVPTFHTLMEQTCLRARKYLNPRGSEVEEQKVTMCSLSGKGESKRCKAFEVFKRAIQEHPRTLFVLVVDESHWGAVKSGAQDKIVNDPELRSPNVIVLQVSATPYCNLTRDSRIPERYVTRFAEDGGNTEDVAEVSDCGGDPARLEQLFMRDHEELNVVRWFPPGARRAPSFYFRLEDYLRTIPSRLRHAAVSRDAGQSEPSIKRPISSQLIRQDPILEERMPKPKAIKGSTAAEFTWLADFLFSMVYFAARWDAQKDRLKEVAEGESERDFHGCWRKFESVLKDAMRTFAGEEVPGRKDGTTCRSHLLEARDKLFLQIAMLLVRDPANAQSLDDLKADRDRTVATFLKGKQEDEKLALQEDKARATYFTETDRIVLSLLSHQMQKIADSEIRIGQMTVVRISNNKFGKFLGTAVKEARGILLGDRVEYTFAVLQDTGNSSIVDSIDSVFKTVPLPEGDSGKTTIASKTSLQYTDLEGLSCVLFLCEKGRMGDTFPKSCLCLDLRIRTSENVTTLVQELGRLSRYFYRFKDGESVQFKTADEALQTLEKQRVFEGSCPPTYGVFAYESSTVSCSRNANFVGYARSLKAWTHECTCRLVEHGSAVPGGQTRQSAGALSKEQIRQGWFRLSTKPSSHASLQDCRIVIFQDITKKSPKGGGKEHEDLVFRTVLEHDAGSDMVVLNEKFPAEQLEKPNAKYAVFRDESCIAELCKQCKFGGEVRLLQDKLPYALVKESVMSALGTARDLADQHFREISDCLRMKTLDRYVLQVPGSKPQISQDRNDYHDYRRTYVAKGSRDGSDKTDVCVDFCRDDPKPQGWVHELRFQLAAECQIGKTGAYLHLLRLLEEEVGGFRLPTIPLPEPAEPLVVPNDTTVKEGWGWVLPYWHDISKQIQPWKLFSQTGLRPGKYHPKAMMQRLALLLRVLGDDAAARKGWQAQFFDRLREAPHKSNQWGELVQSKKVNEKLEALIKETQGWPRAPVELCRAGSGKVAFKVVCEKDLISLLNWDCIATAEELSVFLQALLHGRADLIQHRQGVFELQREIGSCTVQELAWSPATEAQPASSRKQGRSDHPFVARMLPHADVAEHDASSMDTRTLKLAPQMRGIRMADLFGSEEAAWPRVVLRSHADPASLFKLENKRITAAVVPAAMDTRLQTWVLTPSYGRHAGAEQRALLDRSSAYANMDQVTQLLLVRQEQLEAYDKTARSDFVLVCLPQQLMVQHVPNYNSKGLPDCITPEFGGVGYARMFGQLFAYLLGLTRVFMIDDNVQACYQLNLPAMFASSPPEKKPLAPCSFTDVLVALEKQFCVVGGDNAVEVPNPCHESESINLEQQAQPIGKGKPRFLGCPLSPVGSRDEEWRAARGDKAKLASANEAAINRGRFSGESRSFAVVGIRRDPQNYLQDRRPFSITHSVYSFYLLNVEETVRQGLIYSPKPFWEDIDFNQRCEESGLAVLKCNRFFHLKWNSQPRSPVKSEILPETVTIQIEVARVSERDGGKFDVVVDAERATLQQVWPRIASELQQRCGSHTRPVWGLCETESSDKCVFDVMLDEIQPQSETDKLDLCPISIKIFPMFQQDALSPVEGCRVIDHAILDDDEDSFQLLLASWMRSSASDVMLTHCKSRLELKKDEYPWSKLSTGLPADEVTVMPVEDALDGKICELGATCLSILVDRYNVLRNILKHKAVQELTCDLQLIVPRAMLLSADGSCNTERLEAASQSFPSRRSVIWCTTDFLQRDSKDYFASRNATEQSRSMAIIQLPKAATESPYVKTEAVDNSMKEHDSPTKPTAEVQKRCPKPKKSNKGDEEVSDMLGPGDEIKHNKRIGVVTAERTVRDADDKIFKNEVAFAWKTDNSADWKGGRKERFITYRKRGTSEWKPMYPTRKTNSQDQKEDRAVSAASPETVESDEEAGVVDGAKRRRTPEGSEPQQKRSKSESFRKTVHRKMEVPGPSGGAPRAIIPESCEITFRSDTDKELRSEEVEHGSDSFEAMKKAAAGPTTELRNGDKAPEIILAGAVTRFLPSGTSFSKPATLRLPLNPQLRTQLGAQGIKCDLGVFKWDDEGQKWKEIASDLTEISDHVEIQSGSFSCYVPSFTNMVYVITSFLKSALGTPESREVFCYGTVDKVGLRRNDSFAFTVHFCPCRREQIAQGAALRPVKVVGEPVNDLVPLQLPRAPVELDVKIDSQHDHVTTAERDRQHRVKIPESLSTNVTMILNYRPDREEQNQGDFYLKAVIESGTTKKDVMFNVQPRTSEVARGFDCEALKPPRLMAFLVRSAGDDINPYQEGQSLEMSLGAIFDPKIYPHPTFEHFRTQMWMATELNVRIVHFAGHCNQNGTSWLANETGSHTETVNHEIVAKLVSDVSTVLCVVLNACDSEELAKQMIKQGVPLVVCWQGKVEDYIANGFAKVFYARLKQSLKAKTTTKPKDLQDAFRPALREAFEDGEMEVKRLRQKQALPSKSPADRKKTDEIKNEAWVSQAHVMMLPKESPSKDKKGAIGKGRGRGQSKSAAPREEEVLAGRPSESTGGEGALCAALGDWLSTGLDDVACSDGVWTSGGDSEEPSRCATNNKGVWERRALEALGIDCTRIDRGINGYWNNTINSERLEAFGLEETDYRDQDHMEKKHLRFTVRQLREWFPQPDHDPANIRRYADLFQPYGSRQFGAIVERARARKREVSVPKVVFSLEFALNCRKVDLARFHSSSCERHKQMACALEECIGELKKLCSATTRGDHGEETEASDSSLGKRKASNSDEFADREEDKSASSTAARKPRSTPKPKAKDKNLPTKRNRDEEAWKKLEPGDEIKHYKRIGVVTEGRTVQDKNGKEFKNQLAFAYETDNSEEWKEGGDKRRSIYFKKGRTSEWIKMYPALEKNSQGQKEDRAESTAYSETGEGDSEAGVADGSNVDGTKASALGINPKTLKVSELKHILEKHKISHATCTEKKELEDLLHEHKIRITQSDVAL